MRLFFLTLFFLGFLYPIDIDGISVNYSFILVPIFFVFRDRKFYSTSNNLTLLIILYVLIFLIGIFWNTADSTAHAIRRIQSFLIFMTIFAYAVIQIDDEMIKAFKWALICISCAFSLNSIILFFLSGGNLLGYDAKDVVGSQRFGFVSLAAFALLFFFPVKSRLQKTARIGGMVLLFVGIMLTFSRASIVTLLLGSALYFIYALFQWIRRPGLKYFVKGITGVLGTFAVIILLAYLFPFVFEFFNERIFERWFFGGGGADILNPETSEGIRLEILRHILTYVLENPLTGSGYLGPWILTVIDAGSAHNQYTDILFRTGFIGFAGYLYLEYRLLRFLWSQYRDLFWGFIGILIYGFFHETFKESQGAFLLAFLIGMNESYLRSFSKAKTMTCGHIKSDVTTARTL